MSFAGHVDGAAKTQLYSNAELFILPTRSENFGIVVAEAMGHGLPVITTTGAPWKELADVGAGWWINLDDHYLDAAIREACAMAPEQLKEMGKRGRELATSKYSWHSIGGQAYAFYRWLCSSGPQPPFVHVD